MKKSIRLISILFVFFFVIGIGKVNAAATDLNITKATLTTDDGSKTLPMKSITWGNIPVSQFNLVDTIELSISHFDYAYIMLYLDKITLESNSIYQFTFIFKGIHGSTLPSYAYFNGVSFPVSCPNYVYNETKSNYFCVVDVDTRKLSNRNLTWLRLDLGVTSVVGDTIDGSSFSAGMVSRTYYYSLGNDNAGVENKLQTQNDIIKKNAEIEQKLIEEQNKKQDETNSKLDEQNKLQKEENETSKGIFGTLKSVFQTLLDLPGNLLKMLMSLIVPDNFDFIYDFLESLESKLGFIGTIPAKCTEFFLNLANTTFDEMNTITFPGFKIWDYQIWKDIKINIKPVMDILKPFRWVTNVGCVCLCVNYFSKLKNSFGNGSDN